MRPPWWFVDICYASMPGARRLQSVMLRGRNRDVSYALSGASIRLRRYPGQERACRPIHLARAQASTSRRLQTRSWPPENEPSARAVKACRPWLGAEIESVEPEVIVCLGATAAQSLLGKDFRITRDRGKLLTNHFAPHLLATYHPSAVLRAPDKAARDKLRRELTADLKKAAGAVSS
jgi:DNA polymerase